MAWDLGLGSVSWVDGRGGLELGRRARSVADINGIMDLQTFRIVVKLYLFPYEKLSKTCDYLFIDFFFFLSLFFLLLNDFIF